MNTDPVPTEPALTSSEPPALVYETSGFRKIFIGPDEIRAGWRLISFLFLVSALQYLISQRGVRAIPRLAEILKAVQSGGPLTPYFLLIFEPTTILITFLAAGIMSRIERRPFGAYGIPGQGALGKLFWQGCIWGLVFESIEMLAIFAFGGFSFGTLALAGAALVKYTILWAIGFLLVGVSEEFLYRGYAQFTLGSGIGFWPAAILLSAAFGAVHLSNPGERWVGALSVFCFGVFSCFTLRRTGNLWFAIGFHAATDYAETFLYSVPDSGIPAIGRLLNSSLHGPRWLTGGTIGPEGSVMDFAMLAVAFAVFSWTHPSKRAERAPAQN